MATKTTEYGKNWVLKIVAGATQVDNLTTNGFTQARDVRDTTTKDSADDEESEVTIAHRTIPFSGYVSEAAAATSVVTLQGLYDNKNVTVFRFGPTAAGTHYWTGSARLTKLDIDGPHDGNVSLEGELRPTGPVTYSVN